MKLGLVVNPIAGMGGRVGLKGTDGPDAVADARLRGATPSAEMRARVTLEAVRRGSAKGHSLTAARGVLGETSAHAAGWSPDVVDSPIGSPTSAVDTRAAVERLCASGVELLIVVGGDGTLRDVADSLTSPLPVVAVPAGVKMYSGAFARSPRHAARIILQAVSASPLVTDQAEVLDIDEDAYRAQTLSARVFATITVPIGAALLQGPKSSRAGGWSDLGGLAQGVSKRLRPAIPSVVGPGSTTRDVFTRLDIETSLLGVDIVRDRRIMATDVDEARILALADEGPQIVVTPLGGHGILFGRGNQPISPRVIRAASGITVIASLDKIATLEGRSLQVDTGDEALDDDLAGYIRVITGTASELVYPVAAG